jgi:alpha-tubulin suppressor-like RCC1 family protein
MMQTPVSLGSRHRSGIFETRADHKRLVLAALVAALVVSGCMDSMTMPAPAPPEITLATLIITESAVRPSAGAAAASGDAMAYVSHPPGTLLNVLSARIRNVTGGVTTDAFPIVEGGFDPVPIVAAEGDELEIELRHANGSLSLARSTVPGRRPPVVVRTSPPAGRTDVALSVRPLVVFSEPIDPGTLKPSSLRILHGETAIAAEIVVSTGQPWITELWTTAALQPLTTYEIEIGTGIRDAGGDSIEATIRVPFTTLGEPDITSAATLATGSDHTCALDAAGKAVCWGGNGFGQLGDGSKTRSAVPVIVSGGRQFSSIIAGLGFTCGLAGDGQTYCWGGIVPDVTPWWILGPVTGSLRFRSVTGGGWHACGLTSSGEAWCWGTETAGELGDGDQPDPWGYGRSVTSPVQVEGGLHFTELVAGGSHTCGVTVDGATWCWGSNSDSQLGTRPKPHSKYSGTPVRADGERVLTRISAGGFHTCGLDESLQAWCWGANRAGQLGNGTTAGSATPVRVAAGVHFVELHAGEQHTCGLTETGEAWCWGDSYDAAEFGSSRTIVLTPRRVGGTLTFRTLATSGRHTCGVTASGAIWCWGSNAAGQLGLGRTPGFNPALVPGAGPAVRVVAGATHSCSLDASGSASCWGGGYALGSGDTVITAVPVPVAAGGRFGAIDGRGPTTCALTNAGAAYCWGANNFGQLGDGSDWPSAEPVPVSGNLEFAALGIGYYHSCALTPAGEAYCWGLNRSGQLGDGSDADSAVPVPVAGGLRFTRISAGYTHTCAIEQSGKAWCWGANNYGELGSRVTGFGTPVPVAGGGTYAVISASLGYTCAVTIGGTVNCWGDNGVGQLGNGLEISTSDLPLAAASSQRFTGVATGNYFACALSTVRVVWCWGTNYHGELGRSNQAYGWDPSRTPVEVLAPERFRSVDAGSDHACAVSASAAVYCWGSNGWGQLGRGHFDYETEPGQVRGITASTSTMR